MTELRNQLTNIVEDHQACLVLAKSVGSLEVYEGTTATAEDVRRGKTAYSNGKFVEGILDAPDDNYNTIIDASNQTSFNIYTALTKIGELDCSNMTSLTAAFNKFSNLVTAPIIDTSNIQTMNGMFTQCSKLVNVPIYNASNATSLWNMFLNCGSLSNESLNNIMAMCITVTDKYTEGVENGKLLKNVGLSAVQCGKCKSLPNYSALIAAGWTTGY